MRKNRKNKRFIYLISPNEIKEEEFYSNLNQVLSSKKVNFFQLRLKKESLKKQIYIGKKIKKICKKHKVIFLINDNPVIAKKIYPGLTFFVSLESPVITGSISFQIPSRW